MLVVSLAISCCVSRRVPSLLVFPCSFASETARGRSFCTHQRPRITESAVLKHIHHKDRRQLAVTLCEALASVSVASSKKARKAEHVPFASRERQVHEVPMLLCVCSCVTCPSQRSKVCACRRWQEPRLTAGTMGRQRVKEYPLVEGIMCLLTLPSQHQPLEHKSTLPSSMTTTSPSFSILFDSLTRARHCRCHQSSTTTQPCDLDRQLQFQFVMSLGRFSSLFICPATCMFLNSPRTHCPAVWKAWYRSVFSLNSDASWHLVLCWRRTFPLSLEMLYQPVTPVRSQWIHDTSFPHREV